MSGYDNSLRSLLDCVKIQTNWLRSPSDRNLRTKTMRLTQVKFRHFCLSGNGMLVYEC